MAAGKYPALAQWKAARVCEQADVPGSSAPSAQSQ